MKKVELYVKKRLIKLSALVMQTPLGSNLLVLLDICLSKVMGAATAHMGQQNEPISGCGQHTCLMRVCP